MAPNKRGKSRSQTGSPSTSPSLSETENEDALESENTPPPAAPLETTPKNAGGFYRRTDWLAFWVTVLISFIGYYYTLAPDLTLEDSGELCVGSMYAGVPHPPGYPVWTIYSWLFTKLVPFSNIAWRVALSSAVAAAFSCGLLALMVSRGSALILRGTEFFKALADDEEKWISSVCGVVAGLLLAFNGFMWSQAVIVEVYTLGILTFVAVLALMMRWFYDMEKRRYLYLAYFVFGICFTNHQTLILAAIGLEALIILANPSLGRIFAICNIFIYVVGLLAKALSSKSNLPPEGSLVVFGIYNLVGFAFTITLLWLTLKQERTTKLSLSIIWTLLMLIFARMWVNAIGDSNMASANRYLIYWSLLTLAALACLVIYPFITSVPESESPRPASLRSHWSDWLTMGWTRLAWLVGAAFYIYMPIASMTNPPMNWAYPRTVQGFFHSLSRGQYDRITPTESFEKLISQIGVYFSEAAQEYNLVFVIVAILPLAFWWYIDKRDKKWWAGILFTYVSFTIMLIVLLNPSGDMMNRHLNKVFFAGTYVFLGLGIGLGLALLLAMAATRIAQFTPVLAGVLGTLLLADTFSTSKTLAQNFSEAPRFGAIFGIILLAIFSLTLFALINRIWENSRRKLLCLALCALALFPSRLMLANWAENEQRGHLFGFWYGHDMFKPPFEVFPEMEKDAILFGGTDPGRFCPTYMIFCESFIKPEQRRDPDFDRRDVYIITQNALADGTYLQYLRAHYNRSNQTDPPFFQELFKTDSVSSLDKFFGDWLGNKVEASRREAGVYPKKEIFIPASSDSQIAYDEYVSDAQRRMKANQLRGGEDIRFFIEYRCSTCQTVAPYAFDSRQWMQVQQMSTGIPCPSCQKPLTNRISERVQVNGSVAVMAINGLLARRIFDENSTHEFYVEESFPLDWMFPHLTPHGIIMKVNRKPLDKLPAEIFEKDRKFWRKYSERLIADWVSPETTVSEICQWAEQVHYRKNLKSFKGDPKFIRDNDAQKSFSKLRGSIAGLYAWRLTQTAKGSSDFKMIYEEADFAYKQALAFCPYSPETVMRYTGFLASNGRYMDALNVAEVFKLLDPDSSIAAGLVSELKQYTDSEQPKQPSQQRNRLLQQLEQRHTANPTNIDTTLNLFFAYLNEGQTNKARTLIEKIDTTNQVNVLNLTFLAQAYRVLHDSPRQEEATLRLIKISPNTPDVWYDLATVQNTLGKTNKAVESLSRAITESDARLPLKPTARNFRSILVTDTNFNNLRSLPEFKNLLAAPK